MDVNKRFTAGVGATESRAIGAIRPALECGILRQWGSQWVIYRFPPVLFKRVYFLFLLLILRCWSKHYEGELVDTYLNHLHFNKVRYSPQYTIELP
jgi:hypothetical protein